MSDSNLFQAMIANAALPWPHRLGMLRDLVNNLNPETEAAAKAILDSLARNSGEAVYQEKNKQLDAVLKEIQEGPMPGATFIEMLPPDGASAPLAHVLLDDGVEAIVVVARQESVGAPRLGDRVVLDGKGRVLLRRCGPSLKVGDVAQYERRVDDRQIAVTLRAGAEKSVFLAAQPLMDQIKAGQVTPGASLIVSPRRSLALAAIPPQDGFSHYQFLDRSPVPAIRAETHIGAPPPCIDQVTEHVRNELTQPETCRQFHLRRSLTKLFCGVSGSGKSLAVSAIHRRLYEVMSEVTGVPLEELPPRVFRLRPGQVLSMWHGETEKNWERAMSEAEQLADELFTTPDGRKLKLPVLIVLEEVDGMGAQRGREAIQDRILASVLQCLDPARLESNGRLIIVLATTNEPHLVDPALLRRVGGSIENFNRLSHYAFMAVLEKLTDGLPAASNNGYTQKEIWNRHIKTLGSWFFSPNASDPGLVELTYAGSTTPVTRYRRDFLTGALVDRAVQQAASEAARAALSGAESAGVTLEQLARGLDAQLRGIVDQLREGNVGSYTHLPDGVRVASLRRIPQPAHLSFEFIRN